MKNLFIILITLFVSVLSCFAETEKDGRYYYEQGMKNFAEYSSEQQKKAYADFRKSAELGYAPGKMKYGICYLRGRGVEMWTEEGEKITGEAFAELLCAKEKDTNVLYELGNAYCLGFGTKKNVYEGFLCLYKAYQKGHKEATEAVAVCFMEGTGCEKNIKESIKYFEKALDLGSVRAYYYLATFALRGLGTKRDFAKGFDYLAKGEEKGSSDCMFYHGLCFATGTGVAKDDRKAFEYYLKAAEKEHPRAMYYAGKCLREGIGAETDKEKGDKFIYKAAEAGDPFACDIVKDEKEKKRNSN